MAVVLSDNEENKSEQESIDHRRYIPKLKRHITRLEFIKNTPTQNKIDEKKWYGLFRGYIRQDYFEDELRASWGELFYDLIFVACIVHLALEGVHSLPAETETETETHRRLSDTTAVETESSNCGAYDYLYVVFFQFGLFSAFWLETVMYVTHFLFNQCMDEFLRVMYMALILAMGIFIADDPVYHKAFIVSYAILRFFSLFMYLKALLIPRAKCHAFWHLGLYSTLFMTLLIISTCMEHQVIYSDCAATYMWLYFMLFLVEFFGRSIRLLIPTNWLSVDFNIRISMNIPHVAERYGLFVMIILGESLISTVTASLGSLELEEHVIVSFDGTPTAVMQIIIILLTFILSYMIGRLYYMCQPTDEIIMENAENHALGRSNKMYGKLYQAAHQMLFFGLFGYGVGIKIAATHLLHSDRKWIDVLVPGYSLVIVVICLNIIRISHPLALVIPTRIWIQRGIILTVMTLIPLGGKALNQGLLFVAMFVCVIMLIVIDVEGQHMAEKTNIELKEKAEGSVEYSPIHKNDSRSDHNVMDVDIQQ